MANLYMTYMYMLMLVLITLTLVQGRSGSAEEKIQRRIISTTKQVISFKLVTNTTVGLSYMNLSLKHIYGLTILWFLLFGEFFEGGNIVLGVFQSVIYCLMRIVLMHITWCYYHDRNFYGAFIPLVIEFRKETM